jgi:hypothetical protein
MTMGRHGLATRTHQGLAQGLQQLLLLGADLTDEPGAINLGQPGGPWVGNFHIRSHANAMGSGFKSSG